MNFKCTFTIMILKIFSGPSGIQQQGHQQYPPNFEILQQQYQQQQAMLMAVANPPLSKLVLIIFQLHNCA
jgi:hypothetical protein